MFLICQEIPPLVSRPNLTILLELRKKIPYQWGFCWRIIKETHWKRRQTHVHQTCPAQSAAFCAGLWHLLSDRGGYSGADGVLSGAGLCPGCAVPVGEHGDSHHGDCGGLGSGGAAVLLCHCLWRGLHAGAEKTGVCPVSADGDGAEDRPTDVFLGEWAVGTGGLWAGGAVGNGTGGSPGPRGMVDFSDAPSVPGSGLAQGAGDDLSAVSADVRGGRPAGRPGAPAPEHSGAAHLPPGQ